MFEKMNEKLMQRGMFLTFWLRTKNDYFNVKSELTKTLVFQSEIKTEFIQGQDELISGGFPKSLSRKCAKMKFSNLLGVRDIPQNGPKLL